MTKQQAQPIELDVLGMTCDACAHHVTQALQGIPGVEQVQVPGWQSGRAVLTAQPGVDENALIQAVQVAGYQATVRPSAVARDVQSFHRATPPVPITT